MLGMLNKTHFRIRTAGILLSLYTITMKINIRKMMLKNMKTAAGLLENFWGNSKKLYFKKKNTKTMKPINAIALNVKNFFRFFGALRTIVMRAAVFWSMGGPSMPSWIPEIK